MTEANGIEELNATAELTPVQRFVENGRGLWVACQVVTIVCSLFDVYFIVCLSLFWWKQSRSHHKYFSKHARKRNDSQWGSTASRIASINNNSRRNTAVDPVPQHPPDRTPNSRERSNRRWMLLFGLGASSSALLKCLVDQVKFFYAWDSRSDDACEIINDITEVGLYGSTMICVYAFLWVRQWMFYHNPAVKNLIYRKHLIRFSRYLPIVILSLLLVLSVFHLIPIKYRADKGVGIHYLGCVSVYDIANTHEALPIFFYIALTSTFQLSLLGLFLYPLVRRKIDAYRMGKVACPSPSPSHRSRRSSGFRSSQFDVYKADGRSISRDSFLAPPGQPPKGATSSPATMNTEREQSGQNNLGLNAEKLCAPYRSLKSRLFGRRLSESKVGPGVSASTRRKSELRINTTSYTLSKRMQQSVIRAVMWTTMCIISDVTMVTVALLFGPGTPLLLISTMNNFNIVVNQLCLIATYSKWREILFPMCGSTSKRSELQSAFRQGSYVPQVSDISPGLKLATETRFENGSRLMPSPSKFAFDDNSTHTDSQAGSYDPSSAPESPKYSERGTRTKRASI